MCKQHVRTVCRMVLLQESKHERHHPEIPVDGTEYKRIDMIAEPELLVSNRVAYSHLPHNKHYAGMADILCWLSMSFCASRREIFSGGAQPVFVRLHNIATHSQIREGPIKQSRVHDAVSYKSMRGR
ncbi:hypothetical protein BIW11_13007 [Tropilaelaps mercedesae]|uniref:Uncharacterized protein n=1 Tax=Tropilaelaps mercedesae TaxID=418985 RepID=A0A1V9X3Z0_9ACAR|nr:hypothetical protein BIW11_13007 [Tropilaelaps mercedesae]